MKQLSWKTISLFFIAASLVASCSKSDDRLPIINPVPQTTSNKIKTQKSASSESVYEYDNAGRVIKVTTNGIGEFIYNYTADSLIQTRYLANGTVMETYHIKLTGDGLVENYLNEKYPTIFIKYEYNADKTMSRKLNFDKGIPSTITYYLYNNGNLVKDSTVNQGGSPGWYGRTYEYYTDKYSTLENLNRGQSHWGAGNKNAIKTVTYLSNGVATGTQNYQTPEIDVLNRISKTTMLTNNTGSPAINEYTYY